jgi:hypothetical protein
LFEAAQITFEDTAQNQQAQKQIAKGHRKRKAKPKE